MVWKATLALAAGILLGGGAARVENQACANLKTPPAHCLTEAPRVRIANGMVSGVFASGGALLFIELWGKVQKVD